MQMWRFLTAEEANMAAVSGQHESTDIQVS